jgi:hypothetical protein
VVTIAPLCHTHVGSLLPQTLVGTLTLWCRETDKGWHFAPSYHTTSCFPYLPSLGSHRCLQLLPCRCPYSATTDAHILLPWMPVFYYHGCLRVLLTQKEVISLTHFIGPSWSAITTSCFLTSMRCWACFPAPIILGDPRFTSLRHFTPNILGTAAHLGSSSHRSGPLPELGPLRGSAQIATCILPMQTFSH